ncbi:MAG: CesT family type III secretion system chaperone [Desulfovibrionaceae bacterium]|nr:CesT family type III secretion system chaperone [Desulfovibrionaceae bacterium]
MINNAISQFGQRMGLPALALDEHGLAALDVDGVGRIHLEMNNAENHNEFLIYLSTPVPPHDTDLPKRALNLAHYKHGHPYNISTGLNNDNLIIIASLTESEVTVQNLENAVIFLMNLSQKITSVGG